MTTLTEVPSGIAVRDWTLWTVDARLAVTDPSHLDEAATIVDTLCAEVDALASRFRDDSLVRRLAVTGADDEPLPTVMAALLHEALAAAVLTDGDVDPTLGDAMQHLGYDRNVAHLASGTNPRWTAVRRGPAWRSIVLDDDRLTMPAGILLDLGATAKALTADWAARAVATRLGTGVMVNLGGDIATAGRTPDGGWQVLVEDLPGDPSQVVTLGDGFAVATSSTQHRRWTASGQAAHHILDPRTLTPAPVVWKTATVVAPTCGLANTLSTASIVRGRKALRWLGQQGVSARLVATDGTVHRVGGWPV